MEGGYCYGWRQEGQGSFVFHLGLNRRRRVGLVISSEMPCNVHNHSMMIARRNIVNYLQLVGCSDESQSWLVFRVVIKC